MKQNQTVIGSADGPVSVFLAGTTSGHGIPRNIREKIHDKVHAVIWKCKRRLAAARITANPHTLRETAEYIEHRYHARKLPHTCRRYQECRQNARVSLIHQNQPQLLGRPLQDYFPQKLLHADAIRETEQKQMQLYMEKVMEYQEKAKAVPEHVFPVEFECYEIRLKKQGVIHLNMELIHEMLDISISSSQEKTGKALKRIVRDIWMFYGVSSRDIADETKRYSRLVTYLASS